MGIQSCKGLFGPDLEVCFCLYITKYHYGLCYRRLHAVEEHPSAGSHRTCHALLYVWGAWLQTGFHGDCPVVDVAECARRRRRHRRLVKGPWLLSVWQTDSSLLWSPLPRAIWVPLTAGGRRRAKGGVGEVTRSLTY